MSFSSRPRNTLAVLLQVGACLLQLLTNQALVGEEVIVELRNETSIKGTLEFADFDLKLLSSVNIR